MYHLPFSFNRSWSSSECINVYNVVGWWYCYWEAVDIFGIPFSLSIDHRHHSTVWSAVRVYRLMWPSWSPWHWLVTSSDGESPYSILTLHWPHQNAAGLSLGLRNTWMCLATSQTSIYATVYIKKKKPKRSNGPYKSTCCYDQKLDLTHP